MSSVTLAKKSYSGYERLLESYRYGLMWVKKGLLALMDQGLISGSNFLIGVLLARWLVPEQFGAYALAFECLTVLCVIYSALFIEPMSVFGPSVYGNCLPEYWGVMLRIHLGAGLITMLVLGGSALVLRETAKSSSLPWALLGIMLAAPCVLFFWAVRRAMYVNFTPQSAALGALIYCVIVSIGLALGRVFGSMSPFLAFLSMAAGALMAGSVLGIWLKPSLKAGPSLPRVVDVVQRHWTYGRWALAGSVLITLSGSIYYPLLGKFRGLAETGTLKAVLNLSSPIGQLVVALSALLLPYAARRYHEEGAAGVERLAWKFTWLSLGGALAYWLVFLLFSGPIVRFLYAGKYVETASLLPLLALGSVFRIAATVQAVALRAVQLPALVFVAFFISSAVGFLIGVPAVWAFGIRGAVFATALSSATVLGATSILLRRNSRRARNREVAKIV